MKVCTKCKTSLPNENFRKDCSKKDGFYPSCNDCQRKRTGAKKLIHNIIGYYDGLPITLAKGQLYPTILKSGCKKRTHVYIMEKITGKPIPKGFHVHHKDGNKLNWNLENLEIIEARKHHSQHSREMWDKIGKNGSKLKCVSCGKERYYSRSGVILPRKEYECQKCYYKNKRWLKNQDKIKQIKHAYKTLSKRWGKDFTKEMDKRISLIT